MNAVNDNRVALQSLRPLRAGDSTTRSYNVLVGRNLGNMTLTLALPMYQFFGMSAISNQEGIAEREADPSEVSQRKLDATHAKKLALYFLRALVDNTRIELERARSEVPQALIEIQDALGNQPYFATQPIVANLRNCAPGGSDLSVESVSPGFARVFLSDSDVLWVIDGQHRRYAMEFIFDFLRSVLATKKYSKRNALYCPAGNAVVSPEALQAWTEVYKTARQGCNVIIDLHLGLTPLQERQVFHDLNNLGKPVSASLAYQFDNSNPVNLFIKEQLIDDTLRRFKIVERDVSNWHDDDGSIAYKDLVGINARLLLNKTSIAGAKPEEVAAKKQVAVDFWNSVASIPNLGTPGGRLKTVASQPVVLKSLAKLAHEFAFGREPDRILLGQLLDSIPRLDWSHSNPCWRYYILDEVSRQTLTPGLDQYLPASGDGANRDIGGWDADDQLFRFGAKHNDILPVLGDMVRWLTKFPSRHGTRS